MKTDSTIKQRYKSRRRRQPQGTTSQLSTSADVILPPLVSVLQLSLLSHQREKATLFSLPAELITRITYYLTLQEYSRFSRTCIYLCTHFQKELILFLRYVYGLSVRSGSLILFAYGAHLQYRAPKLLDRILDEFFVDANDSQNAGPNINNRVSPVSRQANSRWPTYWSVLYSLDKAPNLDPPVNNINTPGISSCCNECYFQPHQNMSCYKCASAQYQGSESMTNPNPKLQFLQRYASRMNAKFAGRSGRSVSGEKSHNNGRRNEWLITDVRLKKTYNMLIMQNIRYGDISLLRFYLDKYGAPINAQVTFSQEEQVYLGADSELMKLLDEYRIRVVLTP
ncbi:13725_t:CDS:2 [Funneliformis geosporum]|nr:13725_t:CDS:2 [Funneliformis geosporum]